MMGCLARVLELSQQTDERKMIGQFFAVDRDRFQSAIELGINSAATFLVLACGTGSDNRTTSWSAEAVRRYTGMAWSRAKTAIDSLAAAGLVIIGGSRTRPRYKLPDSERNDLIWLPNALVTGVANESPPIARVRQSRTTDALELLVLLYASQDLLADGGLPRWLLHQDYHRETLLTRGANAVLAFKSLENRTCYLVGPLEKFKDPDTGEAWDVLTILEDAQLLMWTPWLTEDAGSDSELIHPLSGDQYSIEIEDALTNYVDLLPDCYRNAATCYEHIIPVPRHIRNATVTGVARLRYLPRTALGAAWLSNYADQCRRYGKVYRALAEEMETTMAATISD